ncbi:Glutamate-ammonia-ligase adenylyltransferase [compost metagenome]
MLTRWSDNVRILELLANSGKMAPAESEALTHAYVTLRDALHHLALQELPGHVEEDAYAPEKAVVNASWQTWLGA